MRAIEAAIKRFPERAELLRRLYLKDEEFRTICEDYALAVSSLDSFRHRPDASDRPETGEFQRLSEELAAELGAYLNDVRED